MGENKLIEFKKSDFTEILSEDEKEVLDDFLNQMVEIHILEPVGRKASDKFTFSNRLYFVYFLIKANLNYLAL